MYDDKLDVCRARRSNELQYIVSIGQGCGVEGKLSSLQSLFTGSLVPHVYNGHPGAADRIDLQRSIPRSG